MACARCTLCNANFPVTLAHSLCPICKADNLFPIENDVPDPEEDLQSRVNHADFERYYEQRTSEDTASTEEMSLPGAEDL